MKFAVLIVGVIGLTISIYSIHKFCSWKLIMKMGVVINLIIYSLLIFMIINKGGISFIEKLIIQDRPQVEAINNKANSNQITYVRIKDKVLIDAPIIEQFPELPRGCEVTSLAMLLQYKGIKTDKMDLAARIKKDKTPLIKKNDKVYWGNPNDGFIGDMYSYSNPGYGVYHEPIKNLADRFLPGQIVDLTGKDFNYLKIYLSQDIPIWIIINTTYKKLPETAFESWQTPDGELKITYKEHSVLITGYDDKYIFFNDPISGIKNRKVLKEDFIKAWKQMGSQAITYNK